MQFKCQHLLPAFSLQEVQIGFIGLALALESTACSCCWIMCIHEVRKAIISLRLWVILVSTPASNNTWVCEIIQYAYAFGLLCNKAVEMGVMKCLCWFNISMKESSFIFIINQWNITNAWVTTFHYIQILKQTSVVFI